MFYRRKIILALIELLGGRVEKLRFQKLLFLFSMKKQDPEYDFVPYKYGCYSYSAHADMNTMIKKGLISETGNEYAKEDKNRYLKYLRPQDKRILDEVVSDYGHMSKDALIEYTYLNYPFYAIRSTIAKEVLPGKLYERVENVTPKEGLATLFTIGYEGISLEGYLQKLVRNNVKLLVDVRKNPLSMKFGFSKTPLKGYCNSLGIEYVHIPELGIASEYRQQLETQEDYDKLFIRYCQTTLNETAEVQLRVLGLLKKHKRIALTCFEAEPCRCHRTHLAESITTLPGFEYRVIHV